MALYETASGKHTGAMASGDVSSDRAVDISRLDIRVGKVVFAEKVSTCAV